MCCEESQGFKIERLSACRCFELPRPLPGLCSQVSEFAMTLPNAVDFGMSPTHIQGMLPRSSDIGTCLRALHQPRLINLKLQALTMGVCPMNFGVSM